MSSMDIGRVLEERSVVPRQNGNGFRTTVPTRETVILAGHIGYQLGVVDGSRPFTIRDIARTLRLVIRPELAENWYRRPGMQPGGLKVEDNARRVDPVGRYVEQIASQSGDWLSSSHTVNITRAAVEPVTADPHIPDAVLWPLIAGRVGPLSPDEVPRAAVAEYAGAVLGLRDVVMEEHERVSRGNS